MSRPVKLWIPNTEINMFSISVSIIFKEHENAYKQNVHYVESISISIKDVFDTFVFSHVENYCFLLNAIDSTFDWLCEERNENQTEIPKIIFNNIGIDFFECSKMEFTNDCFTDILYKRKI